MNHPQGWPKFISNAFVVTPDQKSLVHVYLGPYSVNTTLADGKWWPPRVSSPITSDAMRAHSMSWPVNLISDL